MNGRFAAVHMSANGTKLPFQHVRDLVRFEGLSGPVPDGVKATLLTHQRHRAPKFAVVQNAVSPRAVW